MIWEVDETEGEEDVSETFKDFVKLKLEITSTVPVNKVQRRGKKSPRMLWVELANNDNKYLIFKHLKNLKGKKNTQGFGYSIRETFLSQCRNKTRDIVPSCMPTKLKQLAE